MKYLRSNKLALVAGFLFLGSSALSHDATTENSTEVFDCNYAVTTVSRSDFSDCETNHPNSDGCIPWAKERREHLRVTVEEPCEKRVREAKRPSGCAIEGKKVRILYHQHRDDRCTVAMGCDGKDGRAPEHDHWSAVHVSVDCR